MPRLTCLPSDFRGELKINEPMGGYTSFQAGGHAEMFFRPKDVEDLCFFLAHLPKEVPVVWLGLGSNVLVQDGGIKGAVICTRHVLGTVAQQADGRVQAQAGVSCAKLAKFCMKHSLTGGEFLAGIPGTVGGALAMNAGAFSQATWQYVKSVQLIDRHGQIETQPRENFSVAYRHVALEKNQWFLSAVFIFEACHDDNKAQRARVRALLDKRNSCQPIGTPSFGSVFKNPEGEHAANLIEQCGFKGVHVGGAYVSEKHANFILNDGSATATDAVALIQQVMAKVRQNYGVSLEPEVRLLGDAVC